VKIAGKELRPGREAFIVAEIGVNHGGSVARAIEIIDQLHASGASFDAVKLQYYRTDRLCSSAVPATTRCVLKACELSKDDTEHVLAYAKSLGYAGILSVFNIDDFEDVRTSFYVDAWKIASPDAVNHPLIYRVMGLRGTRPLIVSTGTCDAADVDELAALLAKFAPGDHAMLECVSAYPAEPTFGTIAYMALKYPESVIGFSDHTTHPCAGEFAASSGARIIERHVMHADGTGIDYIVSLTPEQFADYCCGVRTKARLVGHGKYTQTNELPIRSSARQSVTLRRPVAAGERIAFDNITLKRPGTGIPAKDWRKAIDAVAARDIAADVPVVWEDIQSSPPTT
jgi:N,N'-diacetyllegionaminate synthase